MNKTLDELLRDIFTCEIAVWQFTRSKEFVERNGLRGKWKRRLLTGGHAEGSPRLVIEEYTLRPLYWTP